MQKKSDKLMMTLKEKQIKMEEHQLELDAQMRQEEIDFQLQMMQMLARVSHLRPSPLLLHYPTYSNCSRSF